MKIHEYQAKELFRKNGVAVPDGSVAFTVDEAKTVAKKLGAYPVVVKAQIHAGGRGLGGGVKVAKTAEEFDTYANSILGMNLVTKQTGPGGKLVKKLLIEQGLNIAKELYLSILPDRATAKMIIMASEAGAWTSRMWPRKRRRRLSKFTWTPTLGFSPTTCGPRHSVSTCHRPA